jgi:uncharacterized membrane protein
VLAEGVHRALDFEDRLPTDHAMLNRRTLLTAASALALPSLLNAAPSLQDEESSKLADMMGDFNRSLRKLKKAGEDDAKLAAAVTEICRLQHVALDSKNEDPPMLGEGDRAQSAARLAYRKIMQDLVTQLFAAENAALAGDKKAYGAAIDGLMRLKKKGHGEFKPKD